MNRIILIGNGFDIANGLETRYSDFIKWLWKKLNSEYNLHIKDSINECKIKGLITYIPFSSPKEIPVNLFPNGDVFFNEEKTQELCKISFDNVFLGIITTNFKYKNWVDIEDEYFNTLKKCLRSEYKGGIVQLNKDFDYIKEELNQFLTFEYENKKTSGVILHDIQKNFYISDFSSLGTRIIKEEYFSENEEKSSRFDVILNRLKYSKDNIESYNLNIYPNNILFLNFNYTNLPTKILELIYNNKWRLGDWASTPMDNIYIHGELNNSQNPIIFGYGDEKDEDHTLIEKRGGEYLSNIKTINYLKTGNYKKLLSFIESNYYQIYLFGHSCGLSDKALLNTLFEHEHCVSIKPFYYEWEDKNQNKYDNYEDLVKNIYRIFLDKTSMRDKVVSKNYCQPLTQNK